jgi:hypothetical protein
MLYTTFPTWTTLGLNLDARDERLATNFMALPLKYCDMIPKAGIDEVRIDVHC